MFEYPLSMKSFIVIFFLLLRLPALSQNPASFFTLPNKTILLQCGASCTSITATIPHIKQSDDYLVSSIPYTPFPYATPAGNELTPLYNDDVFSSKIPLPFSFCFFGTTYSKLVVGSNSILSFDTTNAGCDNGFTVSPPIPYASGTQCFQFSTYYPKASIFGPYHDIDPRVTTTNRKIEWRIEGVAPNRRFIASYSSVPLFSCNNLTATHQMVIFESTGIVEMYLKSKPFCTDWNNGKAILGMQNFARNKAVSAPGKNATAWGSENMNEAYRFLPSGGASKYKRSELLLNGNVIAVADTTSGTAGELKLNFPIICPTLDSTAYILKVYYEACENSAGEVSFQDTLFVKKPRPAVAITSQNAICTAGGTITVTANGFLTPVQYSLNGGLFQTNNVFNNVTPGNYIITTKDNLNCTVTTPVTVSLNNNLTLQPMTDTTVCSGASFLSRAASNGISFSWSPANGLSNAAILNPTITPNQSTVYAITATLGTCIITKNFTVVALPLPTVSAGSDQTILEGDAAQLSATASPGTYQWTPATGLSAATILKPLATPLNTTTYNLTVTNSQGCKASDDVTITVVPFCVKPMDAFTPNGDGINDLWIIANGSCLKYAEVLVFNRYGAKVYENKNYKNNWNGMYNGKPVPDGTYYYIINYELINSSKLFKKGNVTILR